MVADWYDPGVGGHQTGDKNTQNIRGRVYRVAPTGSKYSVPKLDLSTAAGACAALANPNNATRYLAWTKLHEMQGKAESDLKKLRADKDPRMEARALHLLAGIKGKEQKYIDEALQDKNEDIRCAALRHIRSAQMDAIPAVKKLVADPSAAVRRECALCLHHSKSSEAAELWTQLAKQYDDLL